MKIIIADDSAIIRAMLEQNLSKESDIEIVASVSSGRKAVDASRLYDPDVVICDSDMPEMDGYEATKIISKELCIPVIFFADDFGAAVKAKNAGAVDFIEKPDLTSISNSFFESVIERIYSVAEKSISLCDRKRKLNSDFLCKEGLFKVVCIGASTGGPTAVAEVLKGLGNDFPIPILYAQHIEVGADVKMAEWFNDTCHNITVSLAQDGEIAKAGHVYMSPADKHLVIDYVRSDGTPVLKLSDDAPVRFLRPAVDKLFDSAASFYKKSCLAILLTGMGRDGAESCKRLVDAGGYTIVEDESTCAVFGMPAAAIEEGGACKVLPRGKISKEICALVKGR